MSVTATAPKVAAPAPSVASKEQVYIHLVARAIQALKPADLKFVITNETIQLVDYRQAAFFDVRPDGKPFLTCASGLVSVAESSPYTVWLNAFAASHFDTAPSHTVLAFNTAPSDAREGWQEWLPEHLLLVPLRDKTEKLLGAVLYARERAWTESEISQLTHLHRAYAHCLAALNHSGTGLRSWAATLFKPKFWRLLALVVLAAMFLPMRLSTLAPAEVIALDAFSVAAPQDGVVHSFLVQPNAPVKPGDVLFTLDDTAITNRFEVATKALSIAKADALVAQQRAFDDIRGKAALAASIGRVKEKEAELASIRALMARVEIRAEKSGVAVFSDTNDWIGRPVQTGERVLQIADPKDAGLLMWLPVKDALNLEPGAQVKLFLHTKPLSPINAKLLQTSYQASLSPDNVASYRLKASFAEGEELPRIGLRGTARVSGEWSSLGYYLFRRPIASVREWIGF
jgi:hypothetical protein